ncbi:hypothetical protein [Aureispira anguillae]|uniref:Uncharacterized protein n=1 Tax=Aureispira anguillae TaxID=2864201 RepID=A0A915YGW2_9BACT|nr:hypothetical protein [Aureispira anguillae]BDS12928.1 hypothetical protein AsAng_0036530 [Aureispira anguillae]
MSRKQFKVAGSTHEKKVSKKERQKQLKEQRAQLPTEEVVPTEEDTVQIKNLALYSIVGIGLLLLLMYWIFINSQ